MRHNQNKHSTANHNNPQHQKPEHMTYQYGRNDMPYPQKPRKTSLLRKVQERFKEKEPTPQELQKLAMQARKETLKTQIAKAKSARPSRFSMFSEQGSQPSYRKSSPRGQAQESSWLLGPQKSTGSFLDMGSGPSLSMFGGTPPPKGRGKQQRSGIEDLF